MIVNIFSRFKLKTFLSTGKIHGQQLYDSLIHITDLLMFLLLLFVFSDILAVFLGLLSGVLKITGMYIFHTVYYSISILINIFKYFYSSDFQNGIINVFNGFNVFFVANILWLLF